MGTQAELLEAFDRYVDLAFFSFLFLDSAMGASRRA